MITSIRDIPLSELKPVVQVYAILHESSQYEQVGTGTLEVITDAYGVEPQHYIQVGTEDGKELILRSRVRGQNNYQRQKNAIICWEDKEQKLSHDLAMSFEKVEQCDIYWKLICQKIGKNYLQINGTETLQLPAEHNLSYILDKAKNAYNLIAFYIINSQAFMQALRQVFFHFKENNDQMGTGIIMRITQQILSHCDHRVVATLLSKSNFPFMLELYKENTDIDFPRYFKQRIKLKELLSLSLEVSNSIVVFHNLVFFRDFMIDLSKDICLQQMLNIWIRQTQVVILNKMIHEKVIDQLTLLCEEKSNLSQAKQQEVVGFLFEIIGMVKLAQSDSIKHRLIHQFYSSGILRNLQQMLKSSNFKVLSIFEFICAHNSHEFMLFYKNEKRENPFLNLNDIISKQYSSNPDNSFAQAIISFLNVLLTQASDKNEFLQFFKSNFLFPVFSASRSPFRNLALMLLTMEKVQRLSIFFSLTEKTGLFQKLRVNEREGKKTLLYLFKMVKYMFLIMKKNEVEKYNEEMEIQGRFHDNFIQSGIFRFCLTYLKRNCHKNSILTSIMLQNIALLSEMKYNQYTKVVQEFDFDLKKAVFKPLIAYLQKINLKQKLQNIESTREEIEGCGRKQRKEYFSFEYGQNCQIESEGFEQYGDGIENGRNSYFDMRNGRKNEQIRMENKTILKEKELNYEISSEMQAEDHQ